MDFSDEPRKVVKDPSALAHQINRFDDDLSDKFDAINEFPSKTDSQRNPFIAQNESPKKSSKLFQKSSEMMMPKNNKYDVFKNEGVNGQAMPPAPVQNTKLKTEANPDMFKDFAIAAFSEFKVDKTSSMIHEFSNKLSDQKNIKNGHQKMKVINKRKCERLCECLDKKIN